MGKLARILVIILLIGGLIFVDVPVIEADVSCDVSVSPSSGEASTSQLFGFVVSNTSDTSISWVRFTSPDAAFEIAGASASGWNSEANSSEAIFAGGSSIDVSANKAFSVTVNLPDTEQESGDWTVEVSESTDGSNPVSCSGSTSITVTAASSGEEDTTAPTIDSITISDVSSSSVKISWTTDESAISSIEYGVTDEYGSVKSNSTASTSHSFTLDSLSSNTTYHYFLQSTDGSSNSTQTEDSTFTTAVSGSSSSSSTQTVTVSTTTSTSAQVVKDTLRPSVVISTDLSKPFSKIPRITGRVSDNKSIDAIEYSVDGGSNWQPVDKASLNRASTSFEFFPTFLDDDNYRIKVRAIDSSGNIGVSSEKIIVIDTLPPLVGVGLFTFGPQILDGESQIVMLEGIEQNLFISAVGGPTDITVNSDEYKFSLIKNLNTGLWRGRIKFDKAGVYELTANAVDGAGTRVKRKIASVHVLSRGKIISGKPVKDAKLSVFFLDQLTHKFILWDGKAYDQINPQLIDADGKYSLFLPSGTYYIRVDAPGYKELVTDIFVLKKSTPINTALNLESKKYLKIGNFNIPLFDFSQTNAVIVPAVSAKISTEMAELEGRTFPSVELIEDSKIVSGNSFRGKPHIIAIMNSWNPDTAEQLSILNKLPQDRIKPIVVFPQEKSSRINVLKHRGKYDVLMMTDPTGKLIEELDIKSLPVHIFLDSKGLVKKVGTGILGVDEIMND